MMKLELTGVPGPRQSRRAFSLIEVVLAVGVVGFAMLSIVAMLPVGIMAVQNAETLQATSNIADQLRGQMQLLSFSTINSDAIQKLPATTYYYTTDGIQTNITAPTTRPYNYYYTASFTLSTVTNWGVGPPPSPPPTPAVDCNFTSNFSAASVLVTLTYPPGLGPGGRGNQTNTFSLLVARQTVN